MDADPISVILVKGDSKGDRLLFRYPYAVNKRVENGQQHRRKNPYALTVSEDLLQGPPPQAYNLNKGQLTGFSDEVLSNLFAVKQELAQAKFELKANDVRFVAHPTLLEPCTRKGTEPNRSVILINVIFALQASASHSIVKCYYELSKRLGVALRHEEKRCAYVTQEMKAMIAIHDDFGAREETGDGRTVFEVILEECGMAQALKQVYEDVRSTGLVHLRLNSWIELSFCLPHKVHQLNNTALIIEPETIDKCLQSIRPYHGLLLLVEAAQLVESLSPDASPALLRLVRIYTPLKSLQTLSADADLTLAQVFNLASHLVYWGKATLIYPLCESNVYMSAPNAPLHTNSPLVEKFAEQFPNYSLIQVLSEFSLPTSLRQRVSPLVGEEAQHVQAVVWLLQHRLLVQLHTYMYYMPTLDGLSLHEVGGEGGWSSEDSVSVSSSSGSTGGAETMPPVTTEAWPDSAGGMRQELLAELSHEQRSPLLDTPAGATPDDLRLLVRLILHDYLQGEHHLEEIMYMENVRRSQLLQLIDKFREVLITCEAEDPAISMFYPHYY